MRAGVKAGPGARTCPVCHKRPAVHAVMIETDRGVRTLVLCVQCAYKHLQCRAQGK